MENQLDTTNRLAKFITVGLISGVIAAGVNICYMMLYESMTGYSIERYINFLNVSIASIVPGALSGLLLFATLKGSSSKGINIFLIVLISLAILSFLGPLNNELPDGASMPGEFAGLTIPMHIFAPMIYAVMLIRSVRRD
ncbi:MAG: hypothetical protein CMP59_04650 [Flavobacteriales bacterium]|nr:hypothetical protein [Flavobacteriales bacterium]|tara:strand:- start:202 stop:621 length:420 start_codon:yes stop_codon:yes gene_type:complete